MPESVVAVVPVVASVLGWLCELEIILVMRKGYGITCSVVVRGFTSIAFAVVINCLISQIKHHLYRQDRVPCSCYGTS